MKKVLIQLIVTAAVLTSISCSDYTTGGDVIKKVDFKKFKTYAWLPYIDSITIPNIDQEQLKTYVFTAIDAQMQKRNLKIDTIKPDVLVRFGINLNNSNAMVSTPIYENRPAVGYSYGYYGSSMYYYNQPVQVGVQTQMVTYRNGSLIIDLIDHSTNELVWRGYAYQSKEETMKAPELSKMKSNINQIVSDIFWRCPIKK